MICNSFSNGVCLCVCAYVNMCVRICCLSFYFWCVNMIFMLIFVTVFFFLWLDCWLVRWNFYFIICSVYIYKTWYSDDSNKRNPCYWMNDKRTHFKLSLRICANLTKFFFQTSFQNFKHNFSKDAFLQSLTYWIHHPIWVFKYYVRFVYTLLCILKFCFVFYGYRDTQNKRPIKCVVLATFSFYLINLIFANSICVLVYGFLFCWTALLLLLMLLCSQW